MRLSYLVPHFLEEETEGERITYLIHTVNWYQALNQSLCPLILSPVIFWLHQDGPRKRAGLLPASPWGLTNHCTWVVSLLGQVLISMCLEKHIELVGFMGGMC